MQSITRERTFDETKTSTNIKSKSRCERIDCENRWLTMNNKAASLARSPVTSVEVNLGDLQTVDDI